MRKRLCLAMTIALLGCSSFALADPGTEVPGDRGVLSEGFGMQGFENPDDGSESLAELGPVFPVVGGDMGPRAPGVTGCGEAVFNNLAGATASTGTSGGCVNGVGTNGVATGNGNLITLGAPGGNRDICAVTIRLQNTTDTTGDCALLQPNPFDVTCEIWASCPTAGTAAGPCGNSGATLLGSATTTGIVIAPATAQDVSIIFNPPIASVPNDIGVTFRFSRAGISVQIGGTPTVGSNTNGFFTRCGSASANNGCTRNFGAGINTVLFQVEATLSAGQGSCCNLENGTCVPGVTANDCLAANHVFSLGADCSSCVQAIGGCCLPESCVDGQSILDCAALNGSFKGHGVTCAALPPCETVCSFGHEGQRLDRLGHGPVGQPQIVATVSDNNPALSQAVADNFTPSVDGTITKVRWWGYYRQAAVAAACANQGGSSPDNWTITFYNDALALPFQVVAGPFPVTPTKVVTGWQFNGRDYHRFDVSGLNVPVVANRCYWMEILNHTTGECVFFWATGPMGDLHSAGDGTATGNYQPGDEQTFDMSWCLDIDINSNACDDAIELVGACCLNQGTSCSDNAGPTACLTAGGTFVGFLQSCAPGLCNGACCDPGNPNVCTITTQDGCINNPPFGTFQGVGTVCTPSPCSGACCLADGTCQVTNQLNCEAQLGVGLGGSFTGGATCAQVTCSTFDICSANVLACNSSTTFNNAAQAEQERFDPNTDTAPALSCFGGGAANGTGSFWVAFTGTGADVEVSTCNSVVSDTVIGLYTRADGNCFGVTAADEVACSEDDATCSDPLQSKLCAPTVLNQQYWVQVTSFNQLSVGSITVNVTCPCPVVVPTCATCPADVNNDNTRNGADIAGFVACLLGGGTNCICGDTDASTTTDLNDIPGFVTLLLNNTGACP